MLQTLLADRFQLKIHHVMKDLPVFRLVVAKEGSRLKENVSDAKPSVAMRDGKAFRIVAVHARLSSLVDELSYATDRPVIDETGLAGFYDFEIAWSPRFVREDLAGVEQDPATPPLFSALQKQLGLKLEPGTAPYDTVVIDHAEKPSGELAHTVHRSVRVGFRETQIHANDGSLHHIAGNPDDAVCHRYG